MSVDQLKASFSRVLSSARASGYLSVPEAQAAVAYVGRIVSATDDVHAEYVQSQLDGYPSDTQRELGDELAVLAFDAQVGVAALELLMGRVKHEGPGVYHTLSPVIDQWHRLDLSAGV